MFPNCYQISINFNFLKNSRKTNFLKNIEILIFRILNDVKNVFYVSKVDKFLTKILVSGTGVPNGIYRISFKFWINFFSLNLILLKVFEFGYSENILSLRLSGLFVFQKSSPRFLGTIYLNLLILKVADSEYIGFIAQWNFSLNWLKTNFLENIENRYSFYFSK